jgi:hypothetical protein
MSFWTQKEAEPKRNFRFKITGDKLANTNDPVWWWAKSIDKPSYDVSISEYQLINHKFKYPGIVTWKNISVSMVDFGVLGTNINESLEKDLGTIGYTRPDKDAMLGIGKTSDTVVSNLVIEHLSAEGKVLDKWTLVGAFIVSVSYSKLDYSSDELSEVTLEIAYDYANYGN